VVVDVLVSGALVVPSVVVVLCVESEVEVDS
jgi:hypothetical protein